ncbi:MAG: electron transfer flavoprotein subunit beta/FixA family protein [Proteobacteria bacterium]|nr:electron transfer flavoprotein subunit beta/FixA family protein [Pseudomonadota bacterium]
MEILVFIKSGLDSNVSLKPSPDGRGLIQEETDPIWRMAPDDRAALEEAMRTREALGSGRVTAVTTGSRKQDHALGYCLARGVERAVRIEMEDSAYQDAFVVARVWEKAARKLDYGLIFCGNKNWTPNSSQSAVILAEYLRIPAVTRVVKTELCGPALLRVQRRLEKGDREILECSLPAVLAVDHLIPEPRYVSVNALMISDRQAIPAWELAELGLKPAELEARTRLAALEPPRPRPKKIQAPDSSLSADQKISMLLSGGIAQDKKKGGSDFIKGKPEQVADEIIKFLKEKGLIMTGAKN